MDLNTLLSTVLAVATVVGVALAGLSVGTVRTLRESNSDLRDRVGDLEQEQARDHAQIAALKTERDVLQRTVTAEDAIRELHQAINHHHSESMAAWSDIKTAVERTPT